ncbi:MAG TPA: hypothetical protein VF395_14760 [Polyangiaceae bacterium]
MGVIEAVVDDATARAYAAYRRGLSGQGFDPYYSEEVPRFELRSSDVLVAPGDAHALADGCGAKLVSEQARARLEVCGVTRTEAAKVLASIDGVRTTEDVRRAAGIGRDAWERILSVAFGRVVFAVSAVAALEARVSGTEIVRFPGSPYEIVRSYWENMADVTSRLESLSEAPPSPAPFVRLLRELHALALVGESGRSFYRPSSPILAKESVGIGEFLETESVTEETSEGTRFVSGPRVGAGLIGGALFHELLAQAVDDEEALAPARTVSDASGLSWGRLVTARAAGDERPAPWFCPPRPLSSSHFEMMRSALSDALRGRSAEALPETIDALARFHWAFVRLHPFAFANQCVAMSLVNHVLRRVSGAGIPHHVLDHLALRLGVGAYERAFRTAVEAWIVLDESPVRRTLELVARKRRAFDLLRALEAESSIEAARDLVAARPADSRLVLLSALPAS